MSDPYLGEIRMFGDSLAPVGWAFCDGQLIPISENDALFTLIGTTYGGDGQETFALPNLQSRVPIHTGQGPGMSQTYVLGEAAGVESVTLTVQQIPQHRHPFLAKAGPGNAPTPGGGFLAGSATEALYTSDVGAGLNQLPAQALGPTGGSQPHENMMPFATISFIICLVGIFPHQ